MILKKKEYFYLAMLNYMASDIIKDNTRQLKKKQPAIMLQDTGYITQGE